MKISGINFPDNCSLHFHANGIKMRVSINIEKDLIPFVPNGKLQKGDKFFVYWCATEVPLKYCTPKNLSETYNYLLNRVMINVRRMKQEKLHAEINKLENIQTKLDF